MLFFYCNCSAIADLVVRSLIAVDTVLETKMQELDLVLFKRQLQPLQQALI